MGSERSTKNGEETHDHDYGPVRWFLSTVILKKLKQLVGNQLFANELDLRDWMTPEDGRHDSSDDVWFDYIADTGDDSHVMEVLARHMFRPFAVAADAGTRLTPDASAALARDLQGGELPQGDFLFMGGDTAYVVADQATLWDRVVAPLNRAQRHDGKIRELYGIPGNHDYYDHLVGFNRMFRRPPPVNSNGVRARSGPLPLYGFRRVQDASFIRIKLPGWELWGSDFWTKVVDYRQLMYFRNGAPHPPKNLILCTQTPPIALCGYTATDTDKKSYERLLGPGFDVRKRFEDDRDADQRLLLVSGDTHHYARYRSESANTVCVVAGGGGAFLHPTETALDSIAPVVTYPEQETSRRLFAARLACGIPSMFTAGLLWLVGGLLAAVLVRSAPANLADIPLSALAFWASVALGVATIVIGSKLTSWMREQRTMNYKWRAGMVSSGALNPMYRRARNSGAARTLAHAGILDDLALLVRGLVIAAGVTLPYWLRGYWVAEISGSGLAFTGVGLALVIALIWFACARGAQQLPGARKLPVIALGVAHAVFQLALPLLAVRMGFCTDELIVLAGWAVFGLIAWRLYHRGPLYSVLLAVLWLAQGSALIYLAFAHGATSRDAGWGSYVLGFGFGAFILPLQFGWYLLVAGSFDGHNNELGTAVRSTKYKQWIRFHVTPSRVTGYVIGIDDPSAAACDSARPGEARILDVFAIDAIRDQA